MCNKWYDFKSYCTKSDKKTFWDMPDMKVPCNEITLLLYLKQLLLKIQGRNRFQSLETVLIKDF